MNVGALNSGQPPAAPIQAQNKPDQISSEEAIEICKGEKYHSDYERSRIFTLAIVIGAIAVLIIPAIATGLAALSLCTFELGLLIVTPIALLGIGILIKKIDDETLFWSGDVARIIIDQKKKEEEDAAKKAAAQKVEVKETEHQNT